MKMIRYIAYTALCSLLLAATGCHKEELTMPSDSSTFTIQVTGEGSASVLTRAEVHENVTIPLHLLIYKTGAADGATPVYYQKDQLDNAEGKAIKCTFPPALSVSGKYDVYVVGSPDSDATGISGTMTKRELLDFTQTGIADITSKTKHYMLAGVTTNTSLDPSPTVQIVRNVCRLDFTLTDESGNAFTTIVATLSAPDRTFLFSSALRGTGLDNTFPVGVQNSEQAFTLTPAATLGNFDGSVFFFEKMTTATGVQPEADRVKLAITATTNKGVTFRYATYINADANYITKRNTIYEVSGRVKDGTIIINTIKLPWGEVVQGEEKPDPIIIQPKANTYLVVPNSGAILIPVAQASPGIGVNEVLTAELVWTDVKGTKSGKGLAQDAAVAAIEVIGTGPDAVLMVTPGSELGNAVIAVKGGNVIKWSWNIWVTDYNPEQETGQNTSGGYIFMDRNLGAKSIVPNANGVDIGGNYYQYGRKDPFPAKSSTLTAITTYNAAGTVVTETMGNTTSAENQIRNPYLWGSQTGYPADLDLWEKNGSKTVNDPCPAGWRVPPSGAFADLNDALLPKDAKNEGRQGAHTGYYSYNWYREYHTAGIWNTKMVSNWTSKPNGTTNGFMLRCDNGVSVYPDYPYYRGSGTGMRCVRDWENKKFEKEVRVLTAGNNTPCVAHQLGSGASTRNYVESLNALLTNNFGYGNPVDVFFKHYTYSDSGPYQEGTDYKFGDLLYTEKIDVLYLSWNGGGATPTPEQSKKIVKWLDEDPHRVLIINIDYSNDVSGYTTNRHLFTELGFATGSIVTQNTDKSYTLSGGNSDIYKAFTDGRYGKLKGTVFQRAEYAGYIKLASAQSYGYVPILDYTGEPTKVAMAVNPDRRVILLGDTHWFNNAVLSTNGSLGEEKNGQYALLFANMWAWIAETVKVKESVIN